MTTLQAPYLNLAKVRDTNTPSPWPTAMDAWGGFSAMLWINVDFPQTVPAVLFWSVPRVHGNRQPQLWEEIQFSPSIHSCFFFPPSAVC